MSEWEGCVRLLSRNPVSSISVPPGVRAVRSECDLGWKNSSAEHQPWPQRATSAAPSSLGAQDFIFIVTKVTLDRLDFCI